MYKHAFNSSCIEMRCCALRMPYKKNIDAFLPCLQNQTKYRIFLHKITLESSNCETQTKIKRVFVVIKFIPTTYSSKIFRRYPIHFDWLYITFWRNLASYKLFETIFPHQFLIPISNFIFMIFHHFLKNSMKIPSKIHFAWENSQIVSQFS